MEENENGKNAEVESKANVSEVNTSNGTTEASKGNKIVETLKAKRNLIIGIIVAIIVIILVCTAFIGSPKKAVKNFYSAMNSKNSKKMFKNVDWAGVYVFAQLDEDEYDDFWEEYEDFTDSDEWDDAKDKLDEELDDLYEELDDSLDDSDAKFKVKKFKKVKKLGKNLWEVKTQVETKEDGDKDTNTSSYYVMKKGGKYYLVGGGILSLYSSMF